jgi:hypothetical protein
MGQMNTVIGCADQFARGRHNNRTVAGIMLHILLHYCGRKMLFVWAKHLILFTEVHVKENEK